MRWGCGENTTQVTSDIWGNDTAVRRPYADGMPARKPPDPETDRIIQAALDLARENIRLDIHPSDVAVRAHVPVRTVEALFPADIDIAAGVVQSMADAAENDLKQLPIHTSPTREQQREVLSILLTSSLNHIPQTEVLLNLITTEHHSLQLQRRRFDQFAYSAGLRLLGAFYEEDADALMRVGLMTRLLMTTVTSRVWDFDDDHTRNVFLDVLLAVMNPHAGRPVEKHRPPGRWTD